MTKQDQLKRAAAEKAVEFVPENEYIGIGTGSTINFFIEALGKSGKKIKGAVTTSKKSSELMAQYEIPEIAANEVSRLSIYIDGADEINHTLQMIKGGGGAHLPKKIVANLADQFICIADESKYVSRLGKFPLPIEVIPMARSMVARQIAKLGGQPRIAYWLQKPARQRHFGRNGLGFEPTADNGARIEPNHRFGGKRFVCRTRCRFADFGA